MSTSEILNMIIARIETLTDDYESISPRAVEKITELLEKFTDEIDNVIFHDPETVRR